MKFIYSIFLIVLGSINAFAQLLHTEEAELRFDTYGDSYALDLNKDGIADFDFTIEHESGSNFFDNKISIKPRGNNLVAFDANFPFGQFFCKQWNSEEPIERSKGLWTSNKQVISQMIAYPENAIDLSERGNWDGSEGQYLGVSIEIDGQQHFGWILLNAETSFRSSFEILEYDFNPSPNEEIIAGHRGIEISVPEPEAPEEWGIFFHQDQDLIEINATENQLDDTDFYICTVRGRGILSGSLDPIMSISTAEWAAGYYFMFLESPKRGKAVIKFIVY